MPHGPLPLHLHLKVGTAGQEERPLAPLPCMLHAHTLSSASTPTACSCDNGAGTVFPSQLCTLKQQPTGSDGRPSLDSYGSGPGVPWTSGYLA